LNKVEAGGRRVSVPVGDNGRAIGPFQIHYSYWKDSGIGGQHKDCEDYAYSVKVVTAYFNRYAHDALVRRDYERLARIHNGGPNGWRKPATDKYWAKVKKHLTTEQTSAKL
jgi:hypothetical protein